MRALFFALVLVTLPRLVLAEEAPRSEAPRPEVRIQNRFVEKRRRFALYAGFAYHERRDFYHSPGVEAALSYYVLESLALDLRGAAFFSVASDELLEVVRRTGYIPDSRPSKAAVLVGARYSIAYAKMRLSKKLVIHFEPQAFLYGGIHITQGSFDRLAVAPLFEVGLGFLFHATRHVQVRLDAGLTVGGEQRTSYVAVVGGLPRLSVGVMF